MLGWTKRIFVATLIAGSIVSGGYGISILFSEKEKTIDLTDESKVLWEYVWKYEEARTCDSLHLNGNLKIRDQRKLDCGTNWTQGIIEKSRGESGLWIKGNEKAIIDSFNKSKLQIIREFVLEVSERIPNFEIKGEEVIKRIKAKCKKIAESQGFEYKCEFPSVSKKK